MHGLKPFWIWISIRRKNRLCNHHCLCESYRYSAGRFAYVYIPFKGSQSLANMMSKVTAVLYLHSCVNDSAVHITAVSMTPLCMSKWSQWLYCHNQVRFFMSFYHSGVIDTAVICTVESMTLLKFFQNLHICTAVSMTPLCMSQRCQWLHCARHSGVNESAVKVKAKSDFWWVFLKLWIHEIWGIFFWFVLIGFTPRICYIKGGLSLGLNPGFGVLRFGFSCDMHSGVTAVSMTLLNFYQNLHRCTAVSMTLLCTSQQCQ
jgi:hypothetical protein